MVVLSSLNSYDFCWHVVWRPTFFLFLVNLMYIELPIFYFRDNIPFFLLCVDLLSTFIVQISWVRLYSSFFFFNSSVFVISRWSVIHINIHVSMFFKNIYIYKLIEISYLFSIHFPAYTFGKHFCWCVCIYRESIIHFIRLSSYASLRSYYNFWLFFFPEIIMHVTSTPAMEFREETVQHYTALY